MEGHLTWATRRVARLVESIESSRVESKLGIDFTLELQPYLKVGTDPLAPTPGPPRSPSGSDESTIIVWMCVWVEAPIEPGSQ